MVIAGIATFVIGLAPLFAGGRRRVTIREEVHTTPEGGYRVQRRDDMV